MMAVGDCEVVGISEIDEDRCLECAAKHYGPLRAERLRSGLEDHSRSWWDGPQRYYQWQADDDAGERDCQCEPFVRGIGECPRCCETLCVDCGKRLDRVPAAPEG